MSTPGSKMNRGHALRNLVRAAAAAALLLGAAGALQATGPDDVQRQAAAAMPAGVQHIHRQAPAPAPAVSDPDPLEDTAEFDCRGHGNEACGVEIEGERYIIQFRDGEPVTVEPRATWEQP